MKPTAIIVDIDGTIAHMVDRSPYDPSKYHTDVVDVPIRDLVNLLNNTGYQIIVCSGRDDTYREVTVNWLRDNHVQFNELHMRNAGDKRNDAVIKEEIYLEKIEPHFDINFVLDDRNRVVEMWRRNGLKCLQVAEGDF